jgi:signal transduction histidine kinase
MMEEVERLKTLLNDLLLYARPRKPSLAVVRPKKLCEEVFKLYRSALESKGLKVMSCYSPEEAEVRIDPDQMRQVFTNLCLNAFQASSEGGVIEVESLVEPAGGKWVFRVTNAGIPIPPRTLPFIFEPFFTTRSEGTGLGLAISRRIVEDHGGSLHVESDAKHGTTFTIEIPL